MSWRYFYFEFNVRRSKRVFAGCQEGKGGGRNPWGALFRPQRRANIETFTTAKPNQNNFTKLKKYKQFLQKWINQWQLKFKHLSPDSSSTRKLFLQQKFQQHVIKRQRNIDYVVVFFCFFSKHLQNTCHPSPFLFIMCTFSLSIPSGKRCAWC